MFENILIPVSSEFYSKKILERSIFLAEIFNSTISLIYIIEEKTLHQTDKISDSFRTHYNRLETSNDIIKKSRLRADNIVLNDAKFFLKNKEIPFKEKIVEGELYFYKDGMYCNIFSNRIIFVESFSIRSYKIKQIKKSMNEQLR